MSPQRPRDGHLRGLTFNTHMGASIRNGTLAELVERYSLHFLLLQEVGRDDQAPLRRLLGNDWSIAGRNDSVIAVPDRKRLEVLWFASPPNQHGEDQPRHATRLCLGDRRTGRKVFLQSVHCQPLARGVDRGNLGAVRIQHKQLNAFARASANRPADAVVVDGGDFNQPIGLDWRSLPADRQEYSMHRVWEQAGMTAAHRLARTPAARLDEFMVRNDDHVTVSRHQVIPTRRPGDDHPAVLLGLRVKALR